MLSIRHAVDAVLLLIKGILTLLRESHDMSELERGVQALTQQVAADLLGAILEAMDQELMAQREDSLRLVGTRSRTILTLFGALKIKRRLYRDTETGKTVFLLDEVLGLPAYARISGNLAQMCQLIGLDVPFRQAAKIIGLLVPRVSAMTVWKCFQQAGAAAAKEAQARREAVFEDGVVPDGTRRPPELYIEADGVAIKLQRAAARRAEVRVVVGYEGKENVGTKKKPRRVLKEKHQVAGLVNSRAIWEEASAAFGEVWDMSGIPSVHIGGDGAEWVKEGQEYFQNATYHLDPFHLKKRVTEALGDDSSAREALAAALRDNSKRKAEEALRLAAKTRKGAARKRVQALAAYILGNWDGIQATLDGPTLGTIEGHNWRIVARRMKRRGARWGLKGGDYMPRLLALREEGTLENLLKHTRPLDTERITNLTQRMADRNQATRKKGKEEGEWLKAIVPAISGPSAGEAWIKHVLRPLVEAGYVA
ncbi:hypothetical protein kuro4_11920 [Gelria sp. Kuro-4]|nr:ISLre2 family transposase [Gelria sp. Kuro-4]BCV24419.1 hypothetical protein kuro4_11920 [Gelria sp. Kuro-4]